MDPHCENPKHLSQFRGGGKFKLKMCFTSRDRSWDYGVVEPLQAVLGDVEPPQLALGGQEAVDVGQLVAVQTQIPGCKKKLKFCVSKGIP